MKRRLGLGAAALALSVGLWQLAAGLYIPAKARLAQYLIADAWAGDKSSPWPWADTRPVAKLSVPKLDLTRYVLSGATGRTLAFGAGHMDGTALPGEVGVSVVAGHRDTHLRFLKDLEAGDEIMVENLTGKVVRYRMTDSKVIHKDRASLSLDAESPHLILLTCYPFDDWQPGGPLRYAVTAVAVD